MIDAIKVYVAAPYGRREYVRIVHDWLMEAGLEPCSSWAYSELPEDFSDAAVIEAAIEENDMALEEAEAVLVLAFDGEGGEMFAEVARAIDDDVPVFWVGRRILSAYREGVHRISQNWPSLDAAVRAGIADISFTFDGEERT